MQKARLITFSERRFRRLAVLYFKLLRPVMLSRSGSASNVHSFQNNRLDRYKFLKGVHGAFAAKS